MNEQSMSETNPFPPNPYVIGAPLTGEVGFYGRGETLAAVENALQAAQQNVIVLFGQRRVGKTSLLHQIARRVRDRLPVVPVYFDLQGKSGLALDEVLRQLARNIARALKTDAPPRDIADAQAWFRESFLPGLAEAFKGRRLLLLFDEFDVLGDDQQASEDAASHTLFPYLNELILHESQLAFLFVVGRRIEELTTRYQSIFKQAMYQHVGLLKPGEARELITLPTQGVLDYPDNTLAAMLELTAGHPYLTQLLCYEVYNEAKTRQTRHITPDFVRSRIDAAMESGHGALNWFWDGLPRAERFIMSALAHVAAEDGTASQNAIRHILEQRRIVLTGLEFKDAPDRLIDWDILERLPDSADGFRFKIEMLRVWLRKKHPLDSVRRDVDYISQRAVRLYENGREAQEQGLLEDARDDFRSALKVNPNHSGAQLGLAQVEHELGNFDVAIEEYEKAYQIDETSARDGLVRALMERGDKALASSFLDKALQDFNAALSFAPSHEELRVTVVNVLLTVADKQVQSGIFEKAYELYRKAILLSPVTSTIDRVFQGLWRLILDYISIDKASDAMMIMDSLQNLFGDIMLPESFLPHAWSKLGDALQKNKYNDMALQAYQNVLALAPADPQAQFQIESLEALSAKEKDLERLFKLAVDAEAVHDWVLVEQCCVNLIKKDCLIWKDIDILKLLIAARKKSLLTVKGGGIIDKILVIAYAMLADCGVLFVTGLPIIFYILFSSSDYLGKSYCSFCENDLVTMAVVYFVIAISSSIKGVLLAFVFWRKRCDFTLAEMRRTSMIASLFGIVTASILVVLFSYKNMFSMVYLTGLVIFLQITSGAINYILIIKESKCGVLTKKMVFWDLAWVNSLKWQNLAKTTVYARPAIRTHANSQRAKKIVRPASDCITIKTTKKFNIGHPKELFYEIAKYFIENIHFVIFGMAIVVTMIGIIIFILLFMIDYS